MTISLAIIADGKTVEPSNLKVHLGSTCPLPRGERTFRFFRL